MSTKRFNLKQAEQPDKLDQLFSFTGKIRGADVLLRLVEACGYQVVREALERLRDEPEPVAPPVVKRRKAARPKVPPTESSVQLPGKGK